MLVQVRVLAQRQRHVVADRQRIEERGELEREPDLAAGSSMSSRSGSALMSTVPDDHAALRRAGGGR